ncbi:MAG: RNA polymerase sigma factor [Planctomycetaceae bacterium]|jgi:RNA polymerase sigma-70 factor (ECF subfamily)|nr:RNA polymerase sigma factor [Planctomycetaceae bacterium]
MFSTAQEMIRTAAVNLSQWTDEELILEYQSTRQRAAFEELVSRYERELFNYLKHYLGNAETAEDVFQATFLQVHLKCEQYEYGRKFRPWLYRIATNQAIDLRRKTKHFQIVSIDEPCRNEYGSASFADVISVGNVEPVDGSIRNEQAVEVREAVEKLPDTLRQVLYLVYFQGMKYNEAAESLGIPFGTIKSRLNAAVKKLNTLLTND